MKFYVSCICLVVIVFFGCKKETADGGVVQEVAKSFEKVYGGGDLDMANALTIKNNSLFILGSSRSFDDPEGDHYLLNTDLVGNVIYERTYGSTGEEIGIDILPTSDGHLMLLGTTEREGDSNKDIHLLKVSTNGDLIWERTYGGDADETPSEIVELRSGGFCIVGRTQSFGIIANNIYAIWIDQNGNLMQEKNYGGEGIDGATAVRELNDNSLMLYGYTTNYGAVSRDFYLLKLNSAGDSIWSARYGSQEYEESQAFGVTAEGDYIMHGHSAGTDPLHNMHTIKVNAEGEVLWENDFGGFAHDGGEAMLVATNGNYVLVGRTMSFNAQKRDVYMVIANNDGEVISEHLFGGEEFDRADDIVEYDGAYFMVGQSNSFGNGSQDVYLIRHQIQ